MSAAIKILEPILSSSANDAPDFTHPTEGLAAEAFGRFLARHRGRSKIWRMSTDNRIESIEQSLSQSQELDQDICAHLADAAGLLSEAEALFSKLAEPAWR